MELAELGPSSWAGRTHSAESTESSTDRYILDPKEFDRVQRRLKPRHVQMIAIAGTIGTGLFLGSGQVLASAGPLGAFLAYGFVGSVAYSSMCALGEMASCAPMSGSFAYYAGRWVDQAFGFAVGWNYYFTTATAIPVEISAAHIIVSFWEPKSSVGHGITFALCFLALFANAVDVWWFGEIEFSFSTIKILLLTGLIITGLVVDLGGAPTHDRLGFRYWHDPGALNHWPTISSIPVGRLVAIISVLSPVGFSYQGMEMIAIASAETESPRRNMQKAVRRVFWRIIAFYLLGSLIIGMIVPYNDPDLLNDVQGSNVTVPFGITPPSESPFIIAINRTQINVLPHVVNAAVFTSALSACNSFLFSGSRILYGLALRHQAPSALAYCTPGGLPIVAVLVTWMFSFLALLDWHKSSALVFGWLNHLTSLPLFLTWWSMNLTYLWFYRGLRAQNIPRKTSSYYNSLQPWLAIWGLFWTTIFVLLNGFTAFLPHDKHHIPDIFTAYLGLPVFALLYAFWKLLHKTKIVKAVDMDFVTGIPSLEETDYEERAPTTFLGKVSRFLF